MQSQPTAGWQPGCGPLWTTVSSNALLGVTPIGHASNESNYPPRLFAITVVRVTKDSRKDLDGNAYALVVDPAQSFTRLLAMELASAGADVFLDEVGDCRLRQAGARQLLQHGIHCLGLTFPTTSMLFTTPFAT